MGAMNKMETRIRELESETDAENRRLADSSKNLRRSERRIKDLTFAADEDRKNQERMQHLVDQLQGKIKSYKKQKRLPHLTWPSTGRSKEVLARPKSEPTFRNRLSPNSEPVAAAHLLDPGKRLGQIDSQT